MLSEPERAEIREQRDNLPARQASTATQRPRSPQKAAKTAPNTIRGVTESRRGIKTAQAAVQADKAATAISFLYTGLRFPESILC